MELEVHHPAAWVGAVSGAWRARLTSSPALRMVLATGLTPLPVYAELAAASPSWSQAEVCLLDEFGDLPPGEPNSCDGVLRRTLIDHMAPAVYRAIDADPANLATECAAVDAWLDGGVDLAVLGLGPNGHLGMNEPGSPPTSRTRRVELAEATRTGAERYFEGRAHPTWGVTVGLHDILGATEVWVLATGAAKSDIVRRAVRGEASEDVPASLLQAHPRCFWWLDEDAARQTM